MHNPASNNKQNYGVECSEAYLKLHMRLYNYIDAGCLMVVIEAM